DRRRPRDVLHRDRLQQRRRAAPTRADVAERGVDGPRRRPAADVPLRHPADDLDRADLGRAARLRALVRRGDRDHVHGRGAEHAPDLDLREHPPRAAAAGGERRRLRDPAPDDRPGDDRATPDARVWDPSHRIGGGEMATVTSRKNFVGGEWVEAVEGGTMEVLNPATGEAIAEVPAGTAADVDRAVEAAARAWPEWRDSTPAERAELLLKLADVVDANAEELAEIESRNVGKPLAYARDEM